MPPPFARAGGRLYARGADTGGGRGYNPNSEELEYGIAGGRNPALMRMAFFLRPIEDLFNALPFVYPSRDFDIVGGLTAKHTQKLMGSGRPKGLVEGVEAPCPYLSVVHFAYFGHYFASRLILFKHLTWSG